MTAQQKLNAQVSRLSTERLLEIAMMLALDTSEEATIVYVKVDDELARRMPEDQFIAHCGRIEAMMDAAA